jgi:hypothetical protein
VTRPVGHSPVNAMFLMAQGLCEVRASCIRRCIADTIHPGEYNELRATCLKRTDEYRLMLDEGKAWEVRKGKYAQWSEERYQAAVEMLEGVAEGIRLELGREACAPAVLVDLPLLQDVDVELYREATKLRFVLEVVE